MILRGNFEILSIAVYGRLASAPDDAAVPEVSLELPDFNKRPLPPSIDVVEMADPSQVARELVTSARSKTSLEAAFRHYCGVAAPIETDTSEYDEDPNAPPIPRLMADDSEETVVNSAIRLVQYFQEVVCIMPHTRCSVTESDAVQCEVDAWVDSANWGTEDAKSYIGVVLVLAVIFWAADADETEITRRGLLILRLWLNSRGYRKVSISPSALLSCMFIMSTIAPLGP